MHLHTEVDFGGSSFKNGNNSCERSFRQYVVKIRVSIKEAKRNYHDDFRSDDECSETDYDLEKNGDAGKSCVSNIQQGYDAEQNYKDDNICEKIHGISKRFKGTKTHFPTPSEYHPFLPALAPGPSPIDSQALESLVTLKVLQKMSMELPSFESKISLQEQTKSSVLKTTSCLQAQATWSALELTQILQAQSICSSLKSTSILQAQSTWSALEPMQIVQAQTTRPDVELTQIGQSETARPVLEPPQIEQAETVLPVLEPPQILRAETARLDWETPKILQAETARLVVEPPQILQPETAWPIVEQILQAQTIWSTLQLLQILHAQTAWSSSELTQIVHAKTNWQALYFVQAAQAHPLWCSMKLSPLTHALHVSYPLKATTLRLHFFARKPVLKATKCMKAIVYPSVQQGYGPTENSNVKEKAMELKLFCTTYESTQDPAALEYWLPVTVSALKPLNYYPDLSNLKSLQVNHVCEYKSPTVPTETNLNARGFNDNQMLQTTRRKNKNQMNDICFWNKQNESQGEPPNQIVNIHPLQNSTLENPPDRALNPNNSHDKEMKGNVPEKKEENLKTSKKKCPRGSQDRKTYKTSSKEDFVRNVDLIPSPDEANTKPNSYRGNVSKENLPKKKEKTMETSKEKCSRGSKRLKPFKHSAKDDSVQNADPNTNADSAKFRWDVIPTCYNKWNIFCIVLLLTFSQSYSDSYQQQVECPENYISREDICCSFVQCTPGYQVKTCSTNFTADTCEKCPDGTMIYDSTSSLLVISCLNVRYECPSDTIPVPYVATDKDPKACSKRCRCNTAANYCGTDPCRCRIGRCEKHYTLQQNCGCSPLGKEMGGIDDVLISTETYISGKSTLTSETEEMFNETTSSTTVLHSTHPKTTPRPISTSKPESTPETESKITQHPPFMDNTHNYDILVIVSCILVIVIKAVILAGVVYFCIHRKERTPVIHDKEEMKAENGKAENGYTPVHIVNVNKFLVEYSNVQVGDGNMQYIPLSPEEPVAVDQS